MTQAHPCKLTPGHVPCWLCAQALLSARESDPEAAAEGDRRRIEARAARLDAALAAERKMRMHAARLSRALTSLGSGAAVGGAPWERPNR